MERMPIALFMDRAKAEPILLRLTQAGVHVEPHDELRLEKLWFVPKHSAGVRLEVPAREFERGEQLLLDWDSAEGALRDAIHCPECHSLRVDYPQYARHSLMTNLALGLVAELGLVEKHYYCHDCHYTWPKPRLHPPRARPHLAPHYFIEGIGRDSRKGGVES
jgi:hypothetical protein